MSENYIVINGKRAELTKKQIEQLGIKVEENNRWRAVNGGTYWFVESRNKAFSTHDNYDDYDDFRYYSHNYFYNEEEAKTYARVLETEMLLKKYAAEHNKEFGCTKYCIYFTFDDTWDEYRIQVQGVPTDLYFRPKQVWFSSEDIALSAIKEIDNNRMREYLTYEM